MSDSDDSNSDDDDSSVDEDIMPVVGKPSREMNLGGLVFNSSQFTANPVLEQSLGKLISIQGTVKKTGLRADEKSKPQPIKSAKPIEANMKSSPKERSISTTKPFEMKRVTSFSAMETMMAKLQKAPATYDYNTEMNLEDIMAMRNLTKEHGARTFTKTKSLSAPDLKSTSFMTGFKQMEDFGEEDEEDSSEAEQEGEKPVSKQTASDFSKINPDDLLKSIVTETFGICPAKVAAADVPEYFVQVTPEMISSYDMDLATAVRNEDLRVLSRMHRTGKTLQCCNRFGESVVHTVCRRGSTKLLQFLLDRANVSMKVKCDYGRTPLHDACWTRSPNFEMIAIVVDECPDFLWMTDKRGFTPLSYVQRDQWGIWCVFLQEHKQLLKPKVIG